MPLHSQAIKVCSAGFKEGMPEDERRTRHARLVRHWCGGLQASGGSSSARTSCLAPSRTNCLRLPAGARPAAPPSHSRPCSPPPIMEAPFPWVPCRHREVNAHLLLEGQSSVVRAYHTFQSSMLVSRGLNKGQPACRDHALCEEPSLSLLALRRAALSHVAPAHRMQWALHTCLPPEG